MKIGLSQVLIAIGFACVAYASETKAQEVLDKTVTISSDQVEIKKILEEIESQTKVQFVYSSRAIKAGRKISMHVQNKRLSELMDEFFKPVDIVYKVINSQILLFRENHIEKEKSIQEIKDVEAGARDVEGVVHNEKGEPVSGASIIVKGLSGGTSTSTQGHFKLNITGNKEVTITISAVGYTTQEMKIDPQTSSLEIVLVEVSKSLNEVIVVGYGSQKKKDITGSIASISSKDFDNQIITRTDQILQGRAAGIQVTNGVGGPGGNVKVRIRGSNSMSGSNDPLYVIDGFVGGDLFDINPGDIEDIQILKDASATAIYGSRGANGVILITTKKGQSGKMAVSATANYSSSSILRKLDLLSAAEFAEIVNARNEALGINPTFTTQQIADFKQNGGTNWQDEVTRVAPGQEYHIKASGGSDKTTFFLSGNYLDQKGVILGSSFKRYNIRANISSQVSKKFSIRLNFAGTRRENFNNNDNKSAPFRQATIWAPTTPVYDDKGNFTFRDPVSSLSVNPVALALDLKENGFTNAVNLVGGMKYEFVPGLTLDVGFGVNYNNFQYKVYRGTSINGNQRASASRSFSEGFNIQNTNTLSYTKKIKDQHSITATAVFEQLKYINSGFSADANMLQFPVLGYDNLSLTDAPKEAGAGFSNYGIMSLLGRINYSFADKYLLTASVRRDGSSKFQGDNRWGTFPSIAVGWRLSEEAFMKDQDLINNLKLRASWGQTGSQNIAAYSTLSTYGNTRGVFNNTSQTPGIILSNPANPSLKWETTTQSDIGIDIEVLNGALSFSTDYFDKRTTGLLMFEPLPDYTGGGAIARNIGSVQNKGWEFTLSAYPFRSKNFTWNTNFNFSTLKNKVTSLGDRDSVFTGSNVGGGMTGKNEFVLIVGQPMGSFWGLNYLGVWQQKDAAQANLFGNKPGDSRYEDVDGNNNIGTGDYKVIAYGMPKYNLGWNNTVTYKNLSLNIFIQGVLGFDKMNYTYGTAMIADGDARQAIHADIHDRYIAGVNENTNVPAFSASNKSYLQSSRFVEKGDFIRFKNVSLSYMLPKKLIAGVADIRIFAGVVNLYTITKYSGVDPEATNITSSSDVDQSVDYGSYPNARTFNAGITLNF